MSEPPGAGITESCKPSYRYWESNPGPLQELSVFLASEPPLQPHTVLLSTFISLCSSSSQICLPFIPTQLCVLFCFVKPLSPVDSILFHMGHTLKCRQPPRGHMYKESYLFLSREPPVANSSSAKGETWCLLPPHSEIYFLTYLSLFYVH